MNNFLTSNNSQMTELVESGVSAVTLMFLKTTAMKTIPWLTLVIPLLVIDGIVGVRAAKVRYKKNHKDEDRFTYSRLMRRTIGKTFEYVSWCILGAGLAVISNKEWVAWAVLALPFISELVSIWGHKLELQGVELSISAVWKLIVRKVAEKFGIEIDKEDVDEMIKPTSKRDPKTGRFIKAQDKENDNTKTE